jgi:hypothetical protein
MRSRSSEAVALAPTRDVEITVEEASSPGVSGEKVPSSVLARQALCMGEDRDDGSDTIPHARRVARGTGPLPPREDVARRYAIAAERRRLLTHALHTAANDEVTEAEHAVTDRFVRLEPEEIAPVHVAEGSQPTLRLHEAVDRLRAQAAECRAQAIALNAKLVLFEADRAKLHGASQELHAVREQLIEGSARLDHAVGEIEAVTSVEEQLSTLR